MDEELKRPNPILIVDKLYFDDDLDINIVKKNDHEISKSEEIMLTLIAEIIVEIILREEL